MPHTASPPADSPRPLRPALERGLKCQCPSCGAGELFSGFLTPADHCRACGLDFTGHEAHDFPAYIVILLLGHLIVPTMITVNAVFAIPMGWQIFIWPMLVIVMALALIRPVKGGVIAYQWARRMHGFR
jgi:uncharacterized protein (DUF983 family)